MQPTLLMQAQVEASKALMLNFLFRGLTAQQQSGVALFDWATKRAREPHWYIEGHVPDTLDGRFRVLSAIIAITLSRLESGGARGDAVSVALTERFIEVMESEHRELGLGDPTLGKTIRKLVGILASRTELWRAADADRKNWIELTQKCLYGNGGDPEALEHSARVLKTIADRLAETGIDDFERGRIS